MVDCEALLTKLEAAGVAALENEFGYIHDFDYIFGTTPQGVKAHLVLEQEFNALIAGSQEYELGVHRQALCGHVSRFSEVDDPDPESFCKRCCASLRKRYAPVGGAEA